MAIETVLNGHHHTQAVAATSWVITHNLNTSQPIVDCWVDNGGDKDKVLADTVIATSAQVCTVTFPVAVAGEAFII